MNPVGRKCGSGRISVDPVGRNLEPVKRKYGTDRTRIGIRKDENVKLTEQNAAALSGFPAVAEIMC